MIDIICYEQLNSIVLLYKLNYLNTDKKIKIVGNNDAMIMYYRPVLSITWTKDYYNPWVLPSVNILGLEMKKSSDNSKLDNFTKISEKVKDMDILSYHNIKQLDISYFKDTLKNTILNHLEIVTEKKFIFEDIFTKKWIDIDYLEHQKKFDKHFFEKVLSNTMNTSRILKDINSEDKWKILREYSLLDSLIIKNKQNKKVKKF